MTLKNGIHIQPVVREIPANTNAERIALWFGEYDKLSFRIRGAIKGILPHVFEGYSVADWEQWNVACAARGLQCGVAYGAGETTNAARKGTNYATIGGLDRCTATIIDIEGATWEQPGADTAANALCSAFRLGAPRAQLICETWAVPTSHSGVPYEVFQALCDCFASMDYVNDFMKYGLNRFWYCSSWFDQSWGTLYKDRLSTHRNIYSDRNNRALMPRIHVYQAYGWNDILTSFVTALFASDNAPVILYSQNNSGVWFPPASTWTGIDRMVAIRDNWGYSGPGAVWNFQRDYPNSPLLTVDGLDGPLTDAAANKQE
jgi:hypothetical protein